MAAGRYYLTAAIPYANGEPHIGHAYEVIAVDVMARFMRLDGYDVRFQTGMDEHGQKIEQTAKKLGITPQALVDKVSAQFRALYDRLGVSYDDFIRTTEPRHKAGAQEFWRRMDPADIYLGKYSGWYSVRDEAYFDEGELTAGPNGSKLAPSGAPVEWVEEESYFFRLSAYQDRLLKLYEENPHFIQPESRRNEIVSFVKSGLRDLSISRTTFSWGVPVPDAPKHVMYVWVDALSNYITALGYPGGAEMARWPADLHIIGKDITRFHAIYWPAFLMSAKLGIPKRIFGHGFIYSRGEKMSKSVGNVIAPDELIATYGLDPIRYFLLREAAFGQDVNISHEALVQRMNSDLANDFGNLAQRVLSFVNKNAGATVPQPVALNAADEALLKAAHDLLPAMRAEFAGQNFHRALEALWAVIGDANRYVDEQAPWSLRKSDPARMKTVLYVLAETIRHLAILAQPVMPAAMAKLLDQLAVPQDKRKFADLGTALAPGTALPAPQGVFPRFVEPAA
ncbi:MAG TPA: methionine--tRNA ligase [Stellaceae bacterium]|nr:methionine--tRNA ligase [Stellaceae bacterium]